jgi:hypothetical protein
MPVDVEVASVGNAAVTWAVGLPFPPWVSAAARVAAAAV